MQRHGHGQLLPSRRPSHCHNNGSWPFAPPVRTTNIFRDADRSGNDLPRSPVFSTRAGGAQVPVQDQPSHATIWAISWTLSTTASPESLLLLPRFSTPPRQQRTADLPTSSTLSGWVQATSASGSPDSACAIVADKERAREGRRRGRDSGVKVGS